MVQVEVRAPPAEGCVNGVRTCDRVWLGQGTPAGQRGPHRWGWWETVGDEQGHDPGGYCLLHFILRTMAIGLDKQRHHLEPQ